MIGTLGSSASLMSEVTIPQNVNYIDGVENVDRTGQECSICQKQ